jgi:hypothetical protein
LETAWWNWNKHVNVAVGVYVTPSNAAMHNCANIPLLQGFQNALSGPSIIVEKIPAFASIYNFL